MPDDNPDENAPRKQPGVSDVDDRIISREYRLFQEAEQKKPHTAYERACDSADKIFHINMDPKNNQSMQKAIDFSHLNVTPSGVASLTLLFTFIACFLAFIFLFTKLIFGFGLELGLFLFVVGVSMPFAYYIYTYPHHMKKKYEMDAGSEIVSAVLYMVCYMRNVPSLEGAVDFASRNLAGPLASELRKLMWDVRVGNYLSINEALLDYAEKWEKNREFVESIELLITSLRLTGGKRTALLDESVRVILDGNREGARHYVQNLRMPIMVINAMGVILPVMILVMFPIIAIFLSVDPMMLFIGYDIMLPLVLFFVIENALEKRPATYSKIDISEHPDVPPEGKFFLGKISVSPWPFAIAAAVIVTGFGFFLYYLETLFPPISGQGLGPGIIPGIVVIFGLAIGPIVYNLLLCARRKDVRQDVQKIEAEFKEALFQLGNTIGSGIPVETAMDEATKKMEGLKIKDMFVKASQNIKAFGMTFGNAFFDKNYGSTQFYPSRLVKSVMRAVVESAKKGVKTAAISMISISRYLRGIHRTQEQIKESLNEVVSSLRFQAYILSPMISGVISTMAILIITILQKLKEQQAAFGSAGGTGMPSIISGNLNVSPFMFILIVGVYLVESLILLCYLMSGIDSGEDPVGRQELTGYVLLIGIIAFTVVVIFTSLVFQPLAFTAII